MSLPAVLIRKSTGEIIKRDLYPRTDMALVDGLDPDLEWLLVYIPYDRPDYDPRVFTLTTTEAITTTPHPIYTHLNQFLVTYSTIKRELSDIELAIQNAENVANDGLVPYTDFTKLTLLGLAVTIRYISGQTLSAKEIALKDKILAVAVKVWKNDENLRLLVDSFTSGNEPDIDAGWENVI